MADFSEAQDMLKSMGEYASEHPECEFVVNDDPMTRRLGFSSGSETWSIKLTDLKRSVPSGLLTLFSTTESRLQIAALVKWLFDDLPL